MEGMPRFPMLFPNLKVPAAPLPEDFSLKIKEYILIHFQDDPSNYDAAINEIISMRQQIMQPIPDVEHVCLLKRYYSQMLMMKNRFPMEEGDELEIPFSWSDRIMDMPNVVSYEDIGFELASVMFNIGAVHANIASQQNRESEDSIKNAFMHFQQGAWPLQQVRDTMNSSKYATLDFEKDILTFYVNVLLGQAQECLVEKSMIDHRSNVVVAKLAAHLMDLYGECGRHLEASALCDVVAGYKYKEWVHTCAAKSELYGAISMLYMGIQADEDKKYGERLGYFQLALKHVNNGLQVVAKDKRDSMKQSAAFIFDVVAAKEQNARKENDFIYHERVPSNEELTIIGGICKVKPLSFDPLDPSVGGDDIFRSLLPPTVLKAVSQYEEEKARVKRDILERIAKKDHELSQFVSSLHVESLCLEGDGRPPLPDMLMERNAAFNAQPGAFPILLDKLHKITDLAREADIVLPELLGQMEEVDVPDLLNDDGFKAIKCELNKLNEQHMSARQNHTDLQQAMAAHSDNLRILALPLHQLSERLGETVNKPVDTPEGAALKRILDKTTEMQKQRVMLVQRLNEEMQKDNVAKKLLADRDLDNSATFSRELEKHSETIGYIEQNLGAQDKILDALTDANADFAQFRKQLNDLAESRSTQILALVAAFDVYSDVCTKAETAHSFYISLHQRLNRLKPAIDGIHAAHIEDKEKRIAEKKALEKRMADIARAKEARDAMDDFGGPSQIGGAATVGGPGLVGLQRGDRRDYMEFFRAKMGGSVAPVGLVHDPTSLQMSGVPSPTPSVLSSFPHSPGAGHDLGYGSLSQYQSSGGFAPLLPPPTAPNHPHFVENYGQVSKSQCMPSTMQNYVSMSPPGYGNYQPPNSSTSSGFPTPVFSQQTSHPAVRGSSHVAPAQQAMACRSFEAPLSQQAPLPLMYAGQHYERQQFSSPQQKFRGPLPPKQVPLTQNQWNILSSPAPTDSEIPASSQITSFQNAPSHLAPPTPNPCSSMFHPAQPTLTAAPQNPHTQSQPSYVHAEGNSKQQAGNANIASPWHQGVVREQSTAPSPWHSGVSAQTVLMTGGHQIFSGQPQQTSSCASQQNYGGSTQLYQNPPFSQEASLPQKSMFRQSIQQPAPPPVSQNCNVDLLGSLLGELQLPPPLQPNQPKSVDSTTSSELLVINTPSVTAQSNSRTNVLPSQPTAIVMPMPQQQQQPQPLSFAGPISISHAPSAQSASIGSCTSLLLSDLSDPSKFELGPDDRHKLEKRMLHASFKGTANRPPLDKNDPLNQLDPFWKA